MTERELESEIMKDMGLIEWFVVSAIVLILLATVAGSNKNGGEFNKACKEANGTAVWDGRQYQCITYEA